ncbi:bifunctional proline dehydrogenase/L-glutamate gamma-semialdehyde dehydrogenase PutA [Candidatus Anaplasma sp. TIGMIC]|uniref:bifunctional proline dehydrogenase/L-glutamate gamma-semialdehyde dehydrogenase PutA n=1 Tax=Candidatus Anaplasma sp. TIGMIC TaxID=3020713 RepID=UPI00232FEF93|nr:bifunctional proline dehydrogenase/L-glutamate gamma-semialdehyde dehydrogenase PutA [Candidatus Anaplasma sp. TIGMIC]MDB1135775.1 bifunctional proline dehydrogenase/L-glutamate gamma-semialdehyde dehydrogenase PutA [Candidatus Anaplasma sp. TIGMIC]
MMSSLQLPDELRKRMQGMYNADEKSYVRYLTERTEISQDSKVRIYNLAKQIIEKVRFSKSATIIDAFIQAYGLSTEEGVALMCLAESLLRIPDDCTIDEMIRDKIARATWNKHIGSSSSIFVNASTLALCVGAKILKEVDDSSWYSVLGNLLKNMGEPIIRKAAIQAMSILGNHFIMGKDIESAVAKSRESGQLCSYDLLGESARTKEDGERYFNAYMNAIEVIGKEDIGSTVADRHGISVKISSLHPRYDFTQIDYVLDDIAGKILELCREAKKHNIGVTLDAEDARRLEASLIIFDKVFSDKSLDGWEGLGIAVQAYQKRALGVLDIVEDIAIRAGRKVMVRLVKGAYWDYEIKSAQEQGLDGYPVYTRRAYTDVSYFSCVQRILSKPNTFYPCFATHNAYTLSSILEVADKDHPGFEFQKLYSMAPGLYEYVAGEVAPSIKCRVYAPVGGYTDLLPYLVRRLLENGTNSSFIRMTNDSDVPAEQLLADPLEKAKSFGYLPHPAIPLPSGLFSDRVNSAGVNIVDSLAMSVLEEEVKSFVGVSFKAMPIINGVEVEGEAAVEVFSPANLSNKVGEVSFATKEQALESLDAAHKAFNKWQSTSVDERATIMEAAADLLEKEKGKFFALLIQEGGKVISDVVAEIREAVDFLRYYAALARKELVEPIKLPGPSGEENYMYFESRGVFVCISPWNFPLAIFIGPIAAALVAGNTVIAKPAEQTSIVAYEAVKLMLRAGVPGDVLHFIPGKGEVLGDALVKSDRIAGVVFTGSTETANVINRTLAQRNRDIVPFIAETGGINAMIVDSSALLEQVCDDVINSAFKSAGQRCSSLRILLLQEEIADRQIAFIKGAMDTLRLGDPMQLSTDIGPVIDQPSLDMLMSYADSLKQRGVKLVHKLDVGHLSDTEGYYFPPHVFEIESVSEVEKEVFGPMLHVVRYKKSDLRSVLDAVNSTGYGLTFAIQSRIQSNIDYITERIGAGNVYVNRNQVGAVVGVQPFGGRGLSGTGPKAGGPLYLHRFVTEKTVSVNSTALGCNVDLACLSEE